jgi:hypothetical protein
MATDEVCVFVESWIVDRLKVRDLFAGVTTPAQRRERVRQLILARDLELAIAGRVGQAKTETWGALFERVYQQPLRLKGA